MGSMTLYVPDIGDELTLAEDWTFVLHPERRNAKFWERAELPTYSSRYNYTSGGTAGGECKIIQGPNATVWLEDKNGNQFSPNVTLPKGTVLKCARVYIRARKDLQAYSSLTFTIVKCPEKKLKGRFWVKLADANNMVIETP